MPTHTTRHARMQCAYPLMQQAKCRCMHACMYQDACPDHLLMKRCLNMHMQQIRVLCTHPQGTQNFHHACHSSKRACNNLLEHGQGSCPPQPHARQVIITLIVTRLIHTCDTVLLKSCMRVSDPSEYGVKYCLSSGWIRLISQ